MRRRILLSTLGLAVAAGAFFHLGKSIWHPWWNAWRGERSERDVNRIIGPAALRRLGLDAATLEGIAGITLIGLKSERRLEVWIREYEGPWTKLTEYPFTASSGQPGPKLAEGDGQIPEGCYGIEYLNPNSSYHLSLKIDYPNAFDRRMAIRDGRTRLGGDIFLHGKDVTIGCIPLGDRAIEEIFCLVSRVGKQRARVILAPHDFRTRPANPGVAGIDWETELYREVTMALQPFRQTTTQRAATASPHPHHDPR